MDKLSIEDAVITNAARDILLLPLLPHIEAEDPCWTLCVLSFQLPLTKSRPSGSNPGNYWPTSVRVTGLLHQDRELVRVFVPDASSDDVLEQLFRLFASSYPQATKACQVMEVNFASDDVRERIRQMREFVAGLTQDSASSPAS